MTNLVSVDEARALIVTDLDDTQLTTVIARVEAEISERIGDPQNDGDTTELTELIEGGFHNLYTQRKIGSITSITEDDTALTSDQWRAWPDQGRIERLASGAKWGTVITIVYKPKDERSARKQAIIDITRVQISRTAFKSEGIAGEYNYSAINWDDEALRILRRITFKPI